MYVNYQSLAEEAVQLYNTLNDLSKNMQSLESLYKNIYNNVNWSSDTRDYYYRRSQMLFNNFDIVNNHFLNIKQYLDTVIDNYANIDNAMNNAFSSFGEF